MTKTYDTAAVRDLYGGLARFYDVESFATERLLRVSWLRRWVMGRAVGHVLDVACGTGQNFAVLARSAATSVTALDLTPEMLAKAAGRAAEVGLHDVEMVEMSAESMAFADGSFDTVCSALSTCTFPDPVAALSEMARVVKPGGEVLLLEHGRSSQQLIGKVMDWRAPGHYEMAGCRWTQDPPALVAAAGLEIVEQRSATFGVFTAMVCRAVA